MSFACVVQTVHHRLDRHTFRSSLAPAVYGLSETLEKSSFLKGIKEEAASSNIWVSVGLHEVPESSGEQTGDNKRCYNSQCLVSPSGELASVYRKLHLFDVDFKGTMTISESGTTMKGDVLPDVTETPVGKRKLARIESMNDI